MQPSGPLQAADDYEAVRGLLPGFLSGAGLSIPLLPEVAVQVVHAGPKGSSNAQMLAEIITADAALTSYVLRIAASAAKRPLTPIVSLQHAIAWLGFDEVANIAFTLALQGKMLDVKGQQHRARRLWRHSLASALWSRQLAHVLGQETGMCYLCGLLHDIGKPVTLGAVHEVAVRAGKKLGGNDYERLIDEHFREVGMRVVTAWGLPQPVPSVTARWENYAAAGDARFESNVVNVAHALADYSLYDHSPPARTALLSGAPYRDLGLTAAHGEALFKFSPAIKSELDRYLAG